MSTAIRFDPAQALGTVAPRNKRWLALSALCLGMIMVVLDATVVNVALPSIREDLKFTESTLVWVVNAYRLTFGGFLLLGGRLGDLYGQRKIFLTAIALFTFASLACGLTHTREVLVAARAVQGIAGAIVMAVTLSLITQMFPDGPERARAVSIYSFVCAAGASIGLLLGGALTSTLNWHWIFLINLPIGLIVSVGCCYLLPNTAAPAPHRRGIDFWGATMAMLTVGLIIYATMDSNKDGWISAQTLRLLALALLSALLFLIIEARVPAPLIPLRVLTRPNLRIANITGALWNGGSIAWFFTCALYMQLVLGYGPLQIGLAFLPANLATATFALGLSARLVTRFGIRKPLGLGLLLVTLGLALLARAPVNGRFLTDILPSMLVLGTGAGIAYNPLVLAAMSDATATESGLASGIFNTICALGGALGLASLATLAVTRTATLRAAGEPLATALTGGYHAAFMIGALYTTAAALIAVTCLRTHPTISTPSRTSENIL